MREVNYCDTVEYSTNKNMKKKEESEEREKYEIPYKQRVNSIVDIYRLSEEPTKAFKIVFQEVHFSFYSKPKN